MNTDALEFPPPERPPDLAHELPVLVVPEHTLFPGAVQALDVNTPQARTLVDALAEERNPYLALFLERDELARSAGRGDGPIGILARVLKTMGHLSGNHGLALEGLARVRLAEITRAQPVLRARLTALAERTGSANEVGAQFARLRALVKDAIQHMPELSGDAAALVDSIGDPGRLADLAAANLDLAPEERARLLDAVEVRERLGCAIEILTEKLAALGRESSKLVQDPLRQLWPFEQGAEERIARELAAGRMSSDEARRIRDFVGKGYTIWERLIPPGEVDALLSDIEDIRDHPGHFLTTDFRHGLPYRYSGTDFDSFESIFDPYVNLERARAVCFHPTILRFLELVFDARPVAFQQLLFQRSNGHPLHQDTAYVCVDQPLWLVATWIALEDVVPGRGELTYFEGSHRIPHFFFRDGSKRFNAAHDPPEPYSHHIQEALRAMGCPKRDFLAKKGDVFLWSADLVHGSNPRTRPEAETRRSCVTHYCPETTRPFWFRVLRGHRNFEEAGPRARIASSYYRLPRGPAMARPAFLLPERPRRQPAR
jgi:Lon protease-like protein